MSGNRTSKVAGLIKAEIGQIIQTRLSDPRVGFVTVTDVVLSPDLRIAKVYVSILGTDEQKKQSIEGLEHAKPFIQGELSKRVRLRYLPVLQFYQDESWNYGSKIDGILDTLHLDELPDETDY